MTTFVTLYPALVNLERVASGRQQPFLLGFRVGTHQSHGLMPPDDETDGVDLWFSLEKALPLLKTDEMRLAMLQGHEAILRGELAQTGWLQQCSHPHVGVLLVCSDRFPGGDQ